MPNSIKFNAIDHDRRVALRKLAAVIGGSNLPEDELEAEFLIEELRLYNAYYHGGLEAACRFISANDAEKLISVASQKVVTTGRFTPVLVVDAQLA